MSVAARVLALRGSPRLSVVPLHASEHVTRRLGTSPLARSGPGRVVTFAGVQGGAGVSTATLLMSGAVTRASEHPALAVDLAAGTRGGLGGLAGAWSQSSAQITAELVIGGGQLARPYVQTPQGVHVISPEPQAPIAVEQTARKLLASATEAVERNAADGELAALARDAVTDAALDEFAGPSPATGRSALHKLVGSARGSHSLVAIDLGLADDELLACHAPVGDLHVWVVAARRHDLEVARRRLLSHEVSAARELVLAWLPDGERVGSRGLRSLGEARGCPVVRLGRFDRAAAWPGRERACRSGLEALCRQLA